MKKIKAWLFIIVICICFTKPYMAEAAGNATSYYTWQNKYEKGYIKIKGNNVSLRVFDRFYNNRLIKNSYTNFRVPGDCRSCKIKSLKRIFRINFTKRKVTRYGRTVHLSECDTFPTTLSSYGYRKGIGTCPGGRCPISIAQSSKYKKIRCQWRSYNAYHKCIFNIFGGTCFLG